MAEFDGALAIDLAWRGGLKPDPLLTVSQWSDKHRILSQRASSEPGKWRTSRTPYLKEIMDCLSPASPVRRVVFMKGAQIGGTEAGNCLIGYVIHQAPGPMMAVSPTVELAKRNSKQRIDPLIEESEALKELVKPARSRDSGNTVLSKEFPGGVLILTGANSAVGLRSMPARYLFLDEVDGYPGDVEGEGDPILLAERRSATFQRRKIFLVSTPNRKGLSRIEREYLASDQRKFHVPCPECGERQPLEFGNLTWDEGKPDTARYRCAHCDALIWEHHKTHMLENGEWVATAEAESRQTVGFHLNSLYSPVGWFSWADAVEMYEQAQKNPDLMKGFVNTVLGEPFEEAFEAPDWTRLYDRRETYRIGEVPDGGLFLTAGVDVQKDRLECEVMAWGREKRSWSIDYFVLDGDTARPEVWGQLDRVLAKDWKHACGQRLPIRVMCVDSGYATQDVYAWVRKHPQATWGPAGAVARQQRTVVAIKGRDRDTALLLTVSKADAGHRKRGLKVWSIGTPVAKGELYRWLKLPRPTDEGLESGESYPPGYCHFPQYNEEFFKQLTAERLITRMVKGFPQASWEKEPGKRNEALDCRVYARAAASIYGLDRFEEKHWRRLEEPLRIADMSEDETISAPQQQAGSTRQHRRVIQSGYMRR
ncbi:phage terminase large subunit family protein [Magnetofaba australis]|uniref:Putative bacteriophage tail assembly protein n=1 Tax=Magnetofaba australis IT-1 TaxID=1434232 RepID=A0A1Y2K421_9PROT|nr:phage terminase large subunit family protein [Magnetofaba australis]OSM04155.1 putative bacteriophage tail assembly protein [Magnetofaba australis IT-1]